MTINNTSPDHENGSGKFSSQRKKWSKKEILFIKEYYNYLTNKELSLMLKVDKNKIIRKASKLGIIKPRAYDLINQTFGQLIVQKRFGKNKYGKILWLCKCNCGKYSTPTSGSLLSGTRSCGCLKPDQKFGKNNPHWKGFGDICGGTWSRIKRGSELRKIEFNITIEETWNLFLKQDKKCALTKLPLKFASNSNASDGTASLDRIDSSKGYTIDNIQWVHKDINQIKWNLSQDYFIELCKLIAQNN